ncbi:MAG: HAD family phosphatase [Clostridium sp.]|nr:HAD family phosphatase [Clostridium sp.]
MKAIIFDMDGVIINSEPIHQLVEREMVEDFGGSLPREDHQKFVGATDRYMWEFIKKELDLDMKIEDILKKKEVGFRNRLNEIELVEHFETLIDLVNKEGYKTALASSNNKKTVHLVVDKFNLRDKFDYIITGTEVEKGKPNPEIFLKAAKNLNVDPLNCIVFEDTKNGVEAANRANMKVIGYLDKKHSIQDLSEADKVVYSLKDVDAKMISGLLENKAE